MKLATLAVVFFLFANGGFAASRTAEMPCGKATKAAEAAHLQKAKKIWRLGTRLKSKIAKGAAAISSNFSEQGALSRPFFAKNEKREARKQLRQRLNQKKVKSPYAAWAVITFFVGLFAGAVTQIGALFLIGLVISATFGVLGLFKDEEKMGSIFALVLVGFGAFLAIVIAAAIRNSI